ncbi:23S rRNA (guanosine(2251)-2'-O)-methyltransferase RlmB [Paludicola sp. MB14-C6]|uniref:23S rRNA (guanosine(2251)-2'-O)-methyltransferase RlmB n=1 Tax=Paludihabitans sp. MB14-C6 TaxID=3070656 RepID=UPI0027DC7EFF|nr:23S rRNA (guanosine(2251)-2'-O)-methyltransferase RlmB [Paludicola sp. MB14-C6]WMJ22259.1 23S rRNA (guanosine(2251)-2'-O)-methyltransferase RlmB [Paludicola sp. MB14-C6]
MEQTENIQNQDIISGRNAVIEALKSNRNIDAIYMTNGETQGSINKIKAMAREKGIVVKFTTNQKLDLMSEGTTHQGVVAVCPCADYATVEDILRISEQKGTSPFIIIADEIEDPHNLGALIRTAEACGADGIIIPKRRSASLSATVYKTSAGAASVLPVAKVSNLVSCIKDLKKQNIWVYGADIGGQLWCEHKYNGGVAIVIGSEGNGLGRLVKEECDFITTLPMYGNINSLNASVAGGILMYEVARQRLGK